MEEQQLHSSGELLMARKIIIIAIIAIALFSLFYFVPFPANADFTMNGFIRSADGSATAPCTVKFDGREQRFLLQQNKLKGTIHLMENSQSVTADISGFIVSIPDEDPNGNLNFASCARYDAKQNQHVSCTVYFTDDRSTYVVVDNGTIYCVSSLAEAEVSELFDQITKLANPAK